MLGALTHRVKAIEEQAIERPAGRKLIVKTKLIVTTMIRKQLQRIYSRRKLLSAGAERNLCVRLVAVRMLHGNDILSIAPLGVVAAQHDVEHPLVAVFLRFYQV